MLKKCNKEKRKETGEENGTTEVVTWQEETKRYLLFAFFFNFYIKNDLTVPKNFFIGQRAF